MNKYIKYLLIGASVATMSSCNDFLDKTPESSVTPASYFYAEADLAAFTINLYNFNGIANGSYGISVFANDNATDNQVAMGWSSRFVPGQYQVGTGAWDWTQIYRCNYFLNEVLQRYEAGKIQGNATNIAHYIGEGYMLRAYAYFSMLQSYGDLPIVKENLPDDEAVLIEASKRRPRNLVARFILEDLDNAIKFLSDKGPGGKNRVTKAAAQLFRSRVALYEGTFEKHHKGTAFVPGGAGWPGSDAEGYNADTEIKYFLEEAMKSAKEVAEPLYANLTENTDTKEGFNAAKAVLNPYYAMFCDQDMDKYDEVLMWKDYNVAVGVTHNIQMQLERNGAGTGYSRGLINAFVMRNGLPIYAAGSGYKGEDWEKQGVAATLQERDSRVQLFTKKDGDVEYYTPDNPTEPEFLVELNWTVLGNNETRMVTGFAIKKGKFYDADMARNHYIGDTGSIVFRGVEALLNYIEACYEAKGSIDNDADKYWRAIRRRAKINEDYTVTIASTNMSEEAKGDWGAYSKGELVDPTLYNIRRERRCELIAEGFRWNDLVRWRSCDQINGYKMEGMRYWGSVYQTEWEKKKLVVVDPDGGTGNMSPESEGVYIHPYQISKVNNPVYDGYKFNVAHYLAPLGQATFRQTSAGDKTDYSTSTVYQNPGWPMIAGQGAK